MFKQRDLTPLADRGPLRVMFLITSMPIGGAETLLVNLVRRLDRERFLPEICCLKEPGPLGEELAEEMPVHHHLLHSKYDFGVLNRLTVLFKERRIDAVVTVGAGDKMFWGRLAAWRSGCPVVLSALHSTGWPDGVGRLNRMLTPITDGFIGVAQEHGRYLKEQEGFPAEKVNVIPNGVDCERFQARPAIGQQLRSELNIPADAPTVGIVAALRPEKNHLLFLRAAALMQHDLPEAHFIIVGDGPEREKLEASAQGRNLQKCVHFLGSRSDIPELLSTLNVFMLTSHNEANPVSILEAMATQVPVVSTRVGSVAESVGHGATGYLAEPGHADELAARAFTILTEPATAQQMGEAARRKVVDNWSLESMVAGYENLITKIYTKKFPGKELAETEPVAETETPASM